MVKCKNCGHDEKEHLKISLDGGCISCDCKQFQPSEDIIESTIRGIGKEKGCLPNRFHKEGIRETRDGYLEIYSPHHPNKNKNNCVVEHRLVMEKHLGRFLLKKEVVHHINHNKQDNRIENLELFSSVGKHTMSHHIVRDKNGKFTKHGK